MNQYLRSHSCLPIICEPPTTDILDPRNILWLSIFKSFNECLGGFVTEKDVQANFLSHNTPNIHDALCKMVHDSKYKDQQENTLSVELKSVYLNRNQEFIIFVPSWFVSV